MGVMVCVIFVVLFGMVFVIVMGCKFELFEFFEFEVGKVVGVMGLVGIFEGVIFFVV